MLFRRKGGDAVAAAAAAADDARASGPEGDAPDFRERALDSLTALLRVFGLYAFDTDQREAAETQRACDEWALRISVGSASPERRAGKPLGAVRDWPGLQRFLQEQRKCESEYVERSRSSFRQALACFSDCFSKALNDDRQSDARVGEKLDSLQRALGTRDPAAIQREALAVAATVQRAIDARRKREVEQVWALGERLRELRVELSETRKRAEIDALTQLSNRSAFDEHVRHLTSLGALLGEPPWLILADLDHFKDVNDRHGHPAGDEVLRQVSHCLSRTFLRKQDFVARYGGEEFAALLLDTSEKQAVMLAERLAKSVRELSILHASRPIPVTLSLGLAALGPAETTQSWLGRADAALYRAKSSGRDRHELAEPHAPVEKLELRSRSA